MPWTRNHLRPHQAIHCSPRFSGCNAARRRRREFRKRQGTRSASLAFWPPVGLYPLSLASEGERVPPTRQRRLLLFFGAGEPGRGSTEEPRRPWLSAECSDIE